MMQSFLSQYRWPFGIILSLTVVVIVQIFVVYFALKSEPGLIRQNPYEAGLQYETTIKELESAHQSGIKLKYESRPVSSNTFSVQVVLKGLSAHYEIKSVELELIRPDSRYNDKTLVLKKLNEGKYLVPATLESGYWLTNARLVTTDKNFLFKGSILLK